MLKGPNIACKIAENYWCGNLIHGAENVSVVLLETPYSGQPSERSWQLVSVQDPEVSQPQRELPPWARPVAEHQAAGPPESRKSEDCDTLNTVCAAWFTAFRKHFKSLHSERSQFTSAQGSSWAWVQRCHPPRGMRTCFRCSVASGQMSPTVCCYRCWGRLLPGSLFSSTHPRKTAKPHKQAKSASWPAQVLHWAELNHDFWQECWAAAMEIRYWGLDLFVYLF